jgi:hypothetical protein
MRTLFELPALFNLSGASVDMGEGDILSPQSLPHNICDAGGGRENGCECGGGHDNNCISGSK